VPPAWNLSREIDLGAGAGQHPDALAADVQSRQAIGGRVPGEGDDPRVLGGGNRHVPRPPDGAVEGVDAQDARLARDEEVVVRSRRHVGHAARGHLVDDGARRLEPLDAPPAVGHQHGAAGRDSEWVVDGAQGCRDVSPLAGPRQRASGPAHDAVHRRQVVLDAREHQSARPGRDAVHSGHGEAVALGQIELILVPRQPPRVEGHPHAAGRVERHVQRRARQR
jgi:hypothetical protein